MTTDEPWTIDAILNAFTTDERVLPWVALTQAVERWPEVSPAILALLQAEADGVDPSERTESILFFSVYLMAQLRETRAFRSLRTIATNGERMSALSGDGITEDFHNIFVRAYDGDPAPLRMLIEATTADESARGAAFDTMARLTADGRIDRDETTRYLRHLHATLLPRKPPTFGWMARSDRRSRPRRPCAVG